MIGKPACEGKVVFRSYYQASKILQEFNRRNPKSRGNLYQCPHCRWWHLGGTLHTPNKLEVNKKVKHKKAIDYGL